MSLYDKAQEHIFDITKKDYYTDFLDISHEKYTIDRIFIMVECMIVDKNDVGWFILPLKDMRLSFGVFVADMGSIKEIETLDEDKLTDKKHETLKGIDPKLLIDIKKNQMLRLVRIIKELIQNTTDKKDLCEIYRKMIIVMHYMIIFKIYFQNLDKFLVFDLTFEINTKDVIFYQNKLRELCLDMLCDEAVIPL